MFKAGTVKQDVGDPLTIDSNGSDLDFPATPTKKRGSTAKAAKTSAANNSDSDFTPMTPKKTRGQISMGKKRVGTVGSEDEDVPPGDDQWPTTPKVKGKAVASASKELHESDECVSSFVYGVSSLMLIFVSDQTFLPTVARVRRL